jgi:hypothetical protein
VTIPVLAASAPAGVAAEGLTALVHLVLLVRGLGLAAGVLLAAVGLGLLVLAERLRRPTAVLGGALVAALAAHLVRALLAPWLARLGLPVATGPALAAAAGGVAAGLFPPLFPAAAGALLGALLGVHLPLAGRAALGGGAGAVAGAAVALLGARAVTICLSVTAGGLALGAGLLAIGGAHPLASEVALRPFALLGFALVAAVAGGAYQLARGGPGMARALRGDD